MGLTSEHTGAAFVRWPEGAERRAELARAGVPCLLVVATGDRIPAVGRGEDWVWEHAGEREVAARLAQLATVGRRPGRPAPPMLPCSLAGGPRRVAELLAASPGELVPRRALEAVLDQGSPRLERVVAVARRALASTG